MSGYSGSPLARKLGINAGCRLYVRAGPPDYPELLAPLPADVRMVTSLTADTDLIHIFATRRLDLARAIKDALKAMRPDAALWVSWPKKASCVTTDITENVIRELALPQGLVDIKVCAVDATWSGLKLVIRKNARPRLSKPATRGR